MTGGIHAQSQAGAKTSHKGRSDFWHGLFIASEMRGQKSYLYRYHSGYPDNSASRPGSSFPNAVIGNPSLLKRQWIPA